MADTVKIDHFSDTLCVWAYVSQIRLEELKAELGDRIDIGYHFINMFGCTEERIGAGWQDRGGYIGFGEHVREVCRAFPHVEVNADVWQVTAPRSSAMSHLFLKSVQLLEQKEQISSEPVTEYDQRTIFEQAAWQVRTAFFQDGRDISQLSVLTEIADQLPLPIGLIDEQISNGEAMEALCTDLE